MKSVTHDPRELTCHKCDSSIEAIESSGGTSIGLFTEKYECQNDGCDATGSISGDVSKPARKWQKDGSLFG